MGEVCIKIKKMRELFFKAFFRRCCIICGALYWNKNKKDVIACFALSIIVLQWFYAHDPKLFYMYFLQSRRDESGKKLNPDHWLTE